MLRAVDNKTLGEITAEWDALAPLRHKQINSGDDISYNYVIGPALLSLLRTIPKRRILDAGCGIGAFSKRLSEIAPEVIGVDPSKKSIELAIDQNIRNASFVNSTMEAYSLANKQSFDVVVANMVLMDVLSLNDFLTACRRVLFQGGAIAFSITHPCFWPEYYGYASAQWFHYQNEIIIESPFRISADKNCSLTSTHIHRPISNYVDAIVHAGFTFQALKEPTPPDNVDLEYRSQWRNPRYLVGLCIADEQ